MAYTATIFISTLHDEDDLFGMLMCQPLPNGENAVDVIRYTNTVCQRCMKRGLEACKHAASQMPFWMSKDKQQRIASFASERTRAEFEGTLHSKNRSAFLPERVRDMFGDRFTPPSQPDFVVMGMDFNAAGASNTAIITLYKDRASRRVVVKGYENLNTRRQDVIFSLVERQIVKTREDFPYVPIVICIETNVGFLPMNVRDFVYGRADLAESTFFIYEDRRQDKEHPAVGLVPTKPIKNLLYELIKNNLDVGMSLDERLILPKPAEGAKIDQFYAQSAITAFRRQMTDYSIHSTVTVTGEERTYMHGKHGGRNDDLVCALGFAVAALHYVNMMPRYRNLVM